jgi:hypothetical protein
MHGGVMEEVTAIDAEVVAAVNQRRKTKVSVYLAFPTLLTALLVSK